MRKATLTLAFAVLACAAAFCDSFSFSAMSMKSVMAKGKERTVLSGQAKIVSGTTEIQADYVELYGKDFRYAECSGAIIVIDRERGLKLSSIKLFYDRVDGIMRMEGPSVMEDKKNKLVIKGNYIENDDKNERTVIQISVRILKDDMACRSEFAVYLRSESLLELTGMPVVYRGSDEYRADKITVNVDTEEITMEGNVQGSVKTEGTAPAEGATPGEGTTPGDATPAPGGSAPPPSPASAKRKVSASGAPPDGASMGGRVA